MPAVAPTPFLFTSDTVRIITLDSSVFPTCTVNDGGTITTVQFSQLFNYVTQSDVDFFIEDLTVTFDIVGYSAIRFYQKPANYMPLSVLPTGYTYVNGVFTAPDTSSGTGTSLPSLNGDGCEHLDGTEVTVVGRDTVYSVTRSFHTIYADNAYIVCYDLQSTDGHKLTCPESLLTKYVAPTTTP